MSDRPHIILIMTDQQRFDTIRALGAPWMITPILDRLAEEGTSFSNCFVTSPVCVAARASLFTGQYPHASGVFGNFHKWEPTWVRSLADAGYHCASIGKMHINPHDAPGGFHQRYWVENKDRPLFLEEHDRALYDEWDRALHVRGLEKPSRYNRFARDAEGFRKALGAFEWELPEAMHPDVFVGDTALWWLEDRKAETPLFLQVGFPGPHPPYDPTARHLELYRDADIPVPDVTEAEIAAQPRGQAELRRNMIERNMDAIVWKKRPPAEELLRLRRHYAANVTMIDEKVGQILEVLGRRGYLENALVIFTSDHGDALGDHGHIQKWTMYDSVVRVPLLLWSPGRVRAGQKIDDLVQLMDIAPTVLDAAGVSVPDTFEARSLTPYLQGDPETPVRDVVHAELARDHIQTGSEYILMRRDERYKLVWYLGEDEGELYDLENDPGEVRNLWHDPAQRARRDAMVDAAKNWSIRGLLETRRPPAAAAPQLPTLIG